MSYYIKYMRKKRSPIWKVNLDELKVLVKQSKSLGEILSGLKLNNIGGNANTLKVRLNYEQIDYSHIPLGRGSNKNLRRGGVAAKSLQSCLVQNSEYHRGHLKQRLLKEGLLKNKCSECGQLPQWNGKILVMVLDHRNGVRNDHRIENLRLLCPNCNSQSSTFAGRRKKYK